MQASQIFRLFLKLKELFKPKESPKRRKLGQSGRPDFDPLLKSHRNKRGQFFVTFSRLHRCGLNLKMKKKFQLPPG
jgi:hypothetical protein